MQQCTQLSADSAQMPAPILNIGDKVFLRMEFIYTTRPSWKLADKYLSPIEIIGVARPTSFVLQLPDRCTQPPPLPVEIEGEAEHEVAGILDSKLVRLGYMYPYLYLYVVSLLLVHAWSHQYTPLQCTTARA